MWRQHCRDVDGGLIFGNRRCDAATPISPSRRSDYADNCACRCTPPRLAPSSLFENRRRYVTADQNANGGANRPGGDFSRDGVLACKRSDDYLNTRLAMAARGTQLTEIAHSGDPQ